MAEIVQLVKMENGRMGVYRPGQFIDLFWTAMQSPATLQRLGDCEAELLDEPPLSTLQGPSRP